MFGAAFVFAVLAVLNFKNVNSISLNENDIQQILDSMQRELVSEDQIKYINLNSNPTYEYKKSGKHKNTFFGDMNGKNTEKAPNVPIYVIDTAALREHELQEDVVLQNLLKELLAHHVRIKNNRFTLKDIKREKSNNRNRARNLDRYSKFYLIFNMRPKTQKINEEDMNGITRLISKKPSKQKGKNGPGTYLIKDDSSKGRRGLGPNEYLDKYVEDELNEPKRPRHSDSNKGRTAIPYIQRYVYE